MAKLKLLFLIFAAIVEFYPFCAWCLPYLIKKTIRIDHFLGRCPGVENVSAYCEDTHFSTVRRMYLMSTKIVFKRDLTSNIKIEKTVKIDRFLGRCPGVGNVPLYFENVHFTNVRRMCYISTKIVAKRDLLSTNIKGKTKIAKLDRFLGRCPGYPNLPGYFENVQITHVQKLYYVSAKVVVMRDFIDNIKVLLELQRCKSKEALDSCEPYPDINLKNMCELVTAKFQPWTPFIETLHPAFSCPLKKGTYTTTNGTFDGGPLLVLPVEGWYWRIHAKVFETINKENNLVMCVYVEGQIVNT